MSADEEIADLKNACRADAFAVVKAWRNMPPLLRKKLFSISRALHNRIETLEKTFTELQAAESIKHQSEGPDEGAPEC